MSNVRSTPLPSQRVSKQYRRGRAAAGLAVFILLWGSLWFLNGYFTARSVVAIGAYRGLTLSWGIGWLAHVIMTILELSVAFLSPYLQGVPRFVLILLWLVALPFGVFDVGSSAAGLLQLAQLVNIQPSLMVNSIATLLAEGIAIAPEPVIMWLIIALVRLARE
jgi:hypothetical protein